MIWRQVVAGAVSDGLKPAVCLARVYKTPPCWLRAALLAMMLSQLKLHFLIPCCPHSLFPSPGADPAGGGPRLCTFCPRAPQRGMGSRW